jgi:5-methyltetrahydrofolate--homocysteine methyltransferase
MGNRFLDLLAAKPYLLADGAMGTNLFRQGLATGDCPELWNVEHPDRVANVHRKFVEAGSDIVLTNSFGGTRHRLKLHRLEGRVRELNVAAARIARGVADAAGRVVAVGGSIGPTGELMDPLGPLTPAAAADAFHEQATGLAEGGVDVLWIETMSAKEEVAAAIEAAKAAGLPYVCTMSFDTNARTMMGVTPGDLVDFCHGRVPIPAAFGANCGVGPGELVDSIMGLGARAAAGDVIVAKGNCGVPQYRDGDVVYAGSPETMAAYARLARDAGARIVGGCCGSTAEHIAAMARALSGYTPRAPLKAEAVIETFGPLWAKPETQSPSTRRRARQRR